MESIRISPPAGPGRPCKRRRKGPNRAAPSPWAVACAALVMAVELATAGCTRPLPGENRPSRVGSRVQIVSIRLARPAIHRSLRPTSATITVTIDVRGRPPKGATTMVEVGTYSADPPENSVVYVPTSRDVPLSPGRTNVKFSVRSSKKTMAGSVVVAASLELRRQAGVCVISWQPNYHQWRTRLATLAP